MHGMQAHSGVRTSTAFFALFLKKRERAEIRPHAPSRVDAEKYTTGLAVRATSGRRKVSCKAEKEAPLSSLLGVCSGGGFQSETASTVVSRFHQILWRPCALFFSLPSRSVRVLRFGTRPTHWCLPAAKRPR